MNLVGLRLWGSMEMLKARCGSGSFLRGAVGRAEPRSSGPRSPRCRGLPDLRPGRDVRERAPPNPPRTAPPGAPAPTVQQEPRSGWGRACLGIRSHYQWELKWTVNHRTPLGLSLLATTGWGEEIYIYVFIYRKREK